MKYRVLAVIIGLCMMFSLVSCKKNTNTNNNSTTAFDGNTSTIMEEVTGDAAEATTESEPYTPKEVNESVTIELPEEGTFVIH